MKVEIRTIAEEEVPHVVIACQACGGEIPLHEREIRTSRPVACTACHHSRTLTYREVVTISDWLAPTLLSHLVTKLNRRNIHG